MTPPGSSGARLDALLHHARQPGLTAEQDGKFEAFLSLILRWNNRINLTAIRDKAGILARHFVESIVCARALPPGISTLLDFGSGAGLPGIPIAICRPEITVTLTESQGKKAAFLREAVRELVIAAEVYDRRAETLDRRFDCVALRAVDRMDRAVKGATRLVREGGWLALMTTTGELDRLKTAAGVRFTWNQTVLLPGGEQRIVVLGQQD